ncbi:uncharacterized protein LOC118486494 [Helianthus annuus]|uniref:uncharacterized protein LOC118486494 n=1 Tax=Helianthus annuus TaxID=4232 RepID=UPI001653016B|nr:uncharacterized protein LOC118486494 [Helianthus annuus]
MSLPEGIKHTIKHYGTSYDLWEALRKRYQNSSRQSVGDRAFDEEVVAVKEEKKKALEQKVEKKAAEVSKCMDGVNERTTEVKVTPEPKTSFSMLESDEVSSHSNMRSDDTRMNVTAAELQTMIDKAVTQAIDRSMVDLSFSLTLDAIRNKSVKTSGEGKRKGKEEISHQSNKKKKGSSEHRKDSEFRKNSSQSNNRPKCSNCRKQHSGKCTIDPRAKLCGICKTKGHKTLDCKELKNATFYNCNEEGHIKTNCPKLIKNPRETKKM